MAVHFLHICIVRTSVFNSRNFVPLVVEVLTRKSFPHKMKLDNFPVLIFPLLIYTYPIDIQ